MTEPRNPIYDTMVLLAACLCAQIDADESPATCFCGVVPGDAAVATYGGNCSDANGMAWVRLVSMFPSAGVNIPNEEVGNCGGSLGFTLEMGVIRRVSVGDSRGNPPPPGVLLAQTQQQIKDAMTMQRALLCCDAIENKSFILGPNTPAGTLGDMLGSTWTIALEI